MKGSLRFRTWLARATCLLGLPGLLSAQEVASVTGAVRSQRGEPVSATVETFARQLSTRTDSLGRFVLTLPAGRADSLRVSAVGFAPQVIVIPALTANGQRRVAVVLSPLATLSAVAVVASRDRPLLNTQDATTGGSIEAREIAALPTDARDPIALLYNVPGVTPATGFFGDAPRLSFNGGNALYSQYLVDGLDNNEGFLGGPRVDLPLSAIARMDALVNTYSTAFGRSPDGVVNVTTAGGVNRLTGDIFAYQRPGRPLDARLAVPFGAQSAAVARRQEGFRRTQAGGSLRGALVENTTFVATAYEYTRENEDRIGSTAQAQFLGTETRQSHKGYARLDHGWSGDQVTTLRVAASGVDRAGNGSGVVTPEADISTRRVGSISAITHRSVLAAGRASNEVSVQLGTFRWYFPPVSRDVSRPQVTVVSPGLATEAVVGSSNFIFDESERQWQFRNVFETRLGDQHTLRLGGDIIAARFRLRAASTNPNGAYVVVNNGNVVARPGRPLTFADIPSTVQVLSYTIDARPQQVNLSQTLYGAFIEDTWRPAAALTVIGGLRWDYDDLTSRGGSNADLNNIQPRLSFNWGRTPRDVIRGGVGRYVGRFPYASYSDAIQLGTDGNAVLTFSGVDAPTFGNGPLPSAIPDATIQRVPREIFQLFARGVQQPNSWQGTLGYQRQIGHTWGISADLVYSRTTNLPLLADLNPLSSRLTAADTTPRVCASASSCPGDAARPNNPATAGYRRLSTALAAGVADYAALYVNGRRQLSRGWQVDANWVWSRARNNTEDINFSATQGNCFGRERRDLITGQACTSDEWADANNDRRHRLTVRNVMTSNAGVTWSLIADAQTGVPVNRLAGTSSLSGNATYDLLGAGPIRGNGFIGNSDRFFGVGRNRERLPGSVTLSTSVAFALHPLGLGRFDVRADVFNVLNSLVWGGYANGIGGGGSRTQFGRPSDPSRLFAAAPARQIQLSVRYLFGSHRAGD